MRAVGPRDESRIRVGFTQLSERSRYLRFFSVPPELTDAQVRSFTHIDHVDHEAWIAVDPAVAHEPALGVARYVRLPDEPAMAEAAVTVGDEFQDAGSATNSP